MAGGAAHNVTVAAVNHPELLYMQVTDHLMAGIEDVVGMRGQNHTRVSLAMCFEWLGWGQALGGNLDLFFSC